MKLVPPFLLPRAYDPDLPKVSYGEQQVFDYLSKVNVSSHDVVLHSLNMTRHTNKRWSEMDFLLISLRGILVVEVKGGSISCRDGLWEYSGKKTRLSPAAQVKENYFTLFGEYLNSHFGRKLDKTVSGFACVFTGTQRFVGIEESALCEQGDEITCYEQEAGSAESLKAFFNRAFDHWANKKSGGGRLLTPEEVDAIVSYLRPNFERAPSLNSCLRGARAQFQKLTEEQYGHIDMLQGLDRFMLEGGAGTGKSFLAMYAARGHAAQGQKTLFVTRNPSFASYARMDLGPAGVDVRTLVELDAEAADGAEKYTTLIMDEAQDLCTWDAVGILDNVLLNGLAEGQWAWFGDSNRQISPSVKFDSEVYEYFRSSANHTPPPLRHNVRNTPEVVQAIKYLSGGDIGVAPDHGIGRELVVGQEMDVPAAIAAARLELGELLDGGLEGSEIVLLSPDSDEFKISQRICKQLDLEIAVVDQQGFDYRAHTNKALIATVEGYKGLERPVVMLIGFWAVGDIEMLRSLFYKAVSRANHTVYIAADEKLRASMQVLMAENLGLWGSNDDA
ncbi:NERD domain-containing protein [Pseudomonadales bacterium]|nr:NERD domain-containing protein [Pseudomonadales bacterium]